MPKQYIVENGSENNRWLVKIDRYAGDVTCVYRPGVENAMVLKKAEAIAFARKWKARAWQIKNGLPDHQVWPEG